MDSKYDLQQLIKQYIDSLSEDEKKAMEIAEKQLKTSFSLEKSIGFQNYLKTLRCER